MTASTNVRRSVCLAPPSPRRALRSKVSKSLLIQYRQSTLLSMLLIAVKLICCLYWRAEMDSRPPPIITQGPQNQTLPLSTVAMLPCAAIGDPIPNIRWLRGGRPVPTTTDPRLAQLDSGTLQISGRLSEVKQFNLEWKLHRFWKKSM